MNLDNTFAWLVLVAVIAILYYPLASRIIKRRNRARLAKKSPAPLLGVLYAPSDKDK